MIMQSSKAFKFCSVFHDNVHYFLLGSSRSRAKPLHPMISITDLLRRF